MKPIRIENVSKTYGAGRSAFEAVRDVSVDVAPGELFFLLGPSGCGKTTLLRMIAGLIEPTRGRIFLGERDATDIPAERRGTAMVFQSYALWPHMTVQQNVEFAPKMSGVSRRQRRELARRMLERVQIAELAARKPNQLSGGQQQRVALARALAAGTDFVLMDEPLSNLDARLRALMRGELKRLVKSSGATGVYVTHDQKEALSMADRIAVMNAGRIVQVGTPEALYNRPGSQFVASFLGEANFIIGEVGAGDPLTVRTAAGELIADQPDADFDVGDAVTCCVRPERVRLAGERMDEPGVNSLQVTVESHTYLGEMRQYALGVDASARWRASTIEPPPVSCEPGDKVIALIDAADVRVLPRAGEGED